MLQCYRFFCLPLYGLLKIFATINLQLCIAFSNFASIKYLCMAQYNASIWNLTNFCGIYGRIIPVNEDANGYMKKFHTTTRKEDVEDLYVNFNTEMNPMTFMQIVSSSRDLYVIGHGKAEEDYRGWGFYSKYTLFTNDQIKQLNWKTIEYVGMHGELCVTVDRL